MPQMGPLFWFFLMVFFVLIYILFIIFLYYNFSKYSFLFNLNTSFSCGSLVLFI